MRPSTKESTIQRRVKAALIAHGWHVEVLSCNAYQRGIPDLYCFRVYKDEEIHRWVDVKRPKGGTLTKAQVQKWSLWETIGLGVWIVTGEGNPDRWLMGPPNWRDWWKPRYDKWVCKDPADLLRESNACDVD